MAKFRLYIKQNGEVETFQLNPYKYNDENSTVLNDPYKNKLPLHLKDLEFIVLDDEDVVVQGIRQDKDLTYADPNKRCLAKLYYDGPVSKNNLNHDDNWEVNLMPIPIIKYKYLNGLKSKIKNLLDLEVKDTLAIAEKMAELEAAKSYPDPSWYPIALANLDAKVAKGEPDKPVIRQKLQAKIDALSIGTPDMNVGGGKNNANPK